MLHSPPTPTGDEAFESRRPSILFNSEGMMLLALRQ